MSIVVTMAPPSIVTMWRLSPAIEKASVFIEPTREDSSFYWQILTRRGHKIGKIQHSILQQEHTLPYFINYSFHNVYYPAFKVLFSVNVSMQLDSTVNFILLELNSGIKYSKNTAGVRRLNQNKRLFQTPCFCSFNKRLSGLVL